MAAELAGYAALLASALEAALLLWGPFRIQGSPSYTDVLYLALLAWCLVAGFAWSRPARRDLSRRAQAEGLLFAILVLYLFSYLYAANANMDYVQRFAASGGNVRLAPDSRAERLAATVRYLPLLAVALAQWIVVFRRTPRNRAPLSERMAGRWAFPASLLSGLLMSLSHPSFASHEGFGPLAFVAYVPLFAVLSRARWSRAVFLGTAAWTIQSMLQSAWLGTYSLISLQLVTVLLALEGALFFAVAAAVHHAAKKGAPALAFAVYPLAWTVFDYARSVGFAGYPWGIAGATQYAFVPVIQIASLTGVWGLTLLVLLPSSALAELAFSGPIRTSSLRAAAFAAALLAAAIAAGAIVLAIPTEDPLRTVRLALVQQNTDPRKSDYASELETLRRLTDQALPDLPDLVVWSETAFVPNIRRWSAVDPASEPLAAVVHDFLAYQSSTGTWLLTGNDDYELRERNGELQRLDYNASILFSPSGERVRTYHKMRLVPFTESFPWKEQMPGLYGVLKGFDVYLWEPGAERVIFEHPRFSFFTPICFEDAFPDHVRRFVLAGPDLILNLSNDYWSLTEVEAWQHAANAVFRAVENRLPLVRGTASGLTVSVDPWGRMLDRLDCYTEGVLIADVPLRERGRTLYTAWGDWFPWACAALLTGIAALSISRMIQSRRRAASVSNPL